MSTDKNKIKNKIKNKAVISGNKSITTVAFCIGIIIPAAFLFSLAADLPHVLAITLVGLLISLATRKAAVFSDRTIIYSIVASLVLTVLLDYVFPLADDRFEYLSSFFRLNITVPLAFYIAVAITFIDSRKYSYAIAISAAVFALAFGGNVLRVPLETERFPAADVVLQNFEAVYFICLSLSGIFILFACRNNVQAPIQKDLRKYRIRRGIIYIFIILVLFPACYGGFKLFDYYENHLRGLQNTLLNPRFFQNRSGKTVFGESADLNQMISPQMMKQQQQIVIRALCKTAPGYLRGKTYTKYEDGRWLLAKNVPETMMRQHGGDGSDYRTFSIGKRDKAKYGIEILVSSKLVSKVLFLPGDFQQVDIIANSVKYSENGNVSFQDWITDGGYTAYHNERTADSAWPLPEKPNVAIYTQVPQELYKDLDGILAKLSRLREAKLKKLKLKDCERFFALLKYFQDNFKYKIRMQPENSVDPILSFLKNTKEGHCELFATSMILLLRRQGIPARYVTGFVCTEKHPVLSYYVARLGNSHAWVEAFDRDKKQWLLLEPTPPSGINDYKHEWSTVESWTDILKKAFQQLLSNMRRGYFAQAIIEFFVTLWHLLVMLCWHPVRGPVTGLLLLMLAYYYLRRWRRMHRPPADYARPDAALEELAKRYEKINKKLRDKYELEVTESSTVNEFILALSKCEMPEVDKKRIIDILREYEAIRYRKELPSVENLDDFKSRFYL